LLQTNQMRWGRAAIGEGKLSGRGAFWDDAGNSKRSHCMWLLVPDGWSRWLWKARPNSPDLRIGLYYQRI